MTLKFNVGDRVEAKWCDRPWAPATVQAVDPIDADAAYRVDFDYGPVGIWVAEHRARSLGSVSKPGPVPDDPPIVQALRDRVRALRHQADELEAMLRRCGHG